MVNKSKKRSNAEATKERILAEAKKIFYQKGFSGARMEEIAKAADVNKAMLHYYFTSKDQLFEVVFTEAFKKILPGILLILMGRDPLKVKFEKISRAYFDALSSFPELPVFVLNAIQEDSERLVSQVITNNPFQPSQIMQVVLQQIQEEVDAGNIKPVDPQHVLINLISMSIFPFMMKPVLKGLFQTDDAGFMAFVEARTKLVPEFVWSAISKENEGGDKE